MDFNKTLTDLKTKLTQLRSNQLADTTWNYSVVGVQSFVLLVCFIIIVLRAITLLPDLRVSSTFVPTQCTIVASKMTTSDESYGVGYRANFYVSYLVNDAVVKSAVAANGLDFISNPDQSSQQLYLDQYKIGQQYPCWYSSRTSDVAVLVLRHDWSAAYALIIPSAVFLVVLFYFVNTARKIRKQRSSVAAGNNTEAKPGQK